MLTTLPSCSNLLRMSSNEIRYQSTSVFDILDSQGRTYAWLARQCGCSRSLMTKIKTGKAPIPVWFPERASTALGLPVSALFFDPVLHESSKADRPGSSQKVAA